MPAAGIIRLTVSYLEDCVLYAAVGARFRLQAAEVFDSISIKM